MLSAKGPNKNLALRDKAFLWGWLLISLIILAIYFGIVATVIIFAFILFYIHFGERIKQNLKNKMENALKRMSGKKELDMDTQKPKGKNDLDAISDGHALNALDRAFQKRQSQIQKEKSSSDMK